jgi:hypothetical protein
MHSGLIILSIDKYEYEYTRREQILDHVFVLLARTTDNFTRANGALVIKNAKLEIEKARLAIKNAKLAMDDT